MALSALGTVSRGVGSVVVYTGSAVYKAASRVFTGGRSLWSHMSLRARISLVIAIPVVIAVGLYIKKKWSGNPLGGGGLPPLAALPPEERLRAERERRLAAIEARRAAEEAERIRLAALPAAPPVVAEAPPPPRREIPEHARRAAEAAERRLAALPPPLAGPLVERGGELAPPALGAPLAIPADAAPVVDVPVPGVAADPAPMEVAPVLVEAPPPVALPVPEEVALVPVGPVLADPVLGEAPLPVAPPVPEVAADPVLEPRPPAEAAPDQRAAQVVVATLVYACVLPVVLTVAISQRVRIEGEVAARILTQNKNILEAADRSDVLDDVQILSQRAEELSEDAQGRGFQMFSSVCRTIQQNSALLRPNSKALQIANYAKCVMSVQLGRIYVAHALSKACASAASESPDLNLDRSVQRVDGVLRLAQRTLTEAQQLAGWPDPEVAVVSNLPDIRELVRSLEQEADHAKRVLRIRLPEKIALIRGIES